MITADSPRSLEFNPSQQMLNFRFLELSMEYPLNFLLTINPYHTGPIGISPE